MLLVLFRVFTGLLQDIASSRLFRQPLLYLALLAVLLSLSDPAKLSTTRPLNYVFSGNASDKASLAQALARPLDVNDWNCSHVSGWLGSQGWGWPEMDEYLDRFCKVGVAGPTLYHLEDDVLEMDLKIQYRLHRKIILETINKLRLAQPKGAHLPRDLWEYRAERPTKASIYLSGALCMPRLTVLYLWLFDAEDTLARLADSEALLAHRALGPFVLVGRKERAFGTPGPAPKQEGSGGAGPPPPLLQRVAAAIMGWRSSTTWGFWAMWALAPGLHVGLHALLFWHLHPWVAAYAAVLGCLVSATEAWALYMLLSRDQMSRGEKLSSMICSHCMTPAINCLLSLVQVAVSPVTPAWLGLLLFWVRVLLLPVLTVWASFASWVPGGEEAEGGAGGGPRDRHRRHRSAWRAGSMDVRDGTHWPPPLEVPAELEEAPDVPDSFRCAITLCIMRQPAQTPRGLTYERSAITRWLELHRTDPTTKTPLRRRHLAPNLALRSIIEAWVADQAKARGLVAATPAADAPTCSAVTAQPAVSAVPAAMSGGPACAHSQTTGAPPSVGTAANMDSVSPAAQGSLHGGEEAVEEEDEEATSTSSFQLLYRPNTMDTAGGIARPRRRFLRRRTQARRGSAQLPQGAGAGAGSGSPPFVFPTHAQQGSPAAAGPQTPPASSTPGPAPFHAVGRRAEEGAQSQQAAGRRSGPSGQAVTAAAAPATEAAEFMAGLADGPVSRPQTSSQHPSSSAGSAASQELLQASGPHAEADASAASPADSALSTGLQASQPASCSAAAASRGAEEQRQPLTVLSPAQQQPPHEAGRLQRLVLPDSPTATVRDRPAPGRRRDSSGSEASVAAMRREGAVSDSDMSDTASSMPTPSLPQGHHTPSSQPGRSGWSAWELQQQRQQQQWGGVTGSSHQWAVESLVPSDAAPPTVNGNSAPVLVSKPVSGASNVHSAELPVHRSSSRDQRQSGTEHADGNQRNGAKAETQVDEECSEGSCEGEVGF